MKQLEQVRLLLGTIRHLQPTQVWYRGRRLVRKRWGHWQKQVAPQPTKWVYRPTAPLFGGLTEAPLIRTECPEYIHQLAVAVDSAQQTFCFLSQRVAMPGEIGWHDPNLSQLWRYHLHYFGYVPALLLWSAAGEEAAAYQTFRNLVSSWIDHNQQLTGDGWHPYTLSLRLVNWLHGIHGFAAQLAVDAEFHQRLLRSTYGQAQYLFSDLELDVRGNHLLENIRALLWLGIAFQGDEPQRWFQRALQLLESEVAEQVLADGGHFERTPTYHLVVLKDLLEIALWLQRNRRIQLAWLDAALRRMLNYLLDILPPGGNVPLLKDSAWDAGPCPADLLVAGAIYLQEGEFKLDEDFRLYPYLLFGKAGLEEYRALPNNNARPASSSQLVTQSEYGVMHGCVAQDYLIWDVGKPCPDYLPAHAHADLLSYELSIAGQRVIVDSGVYEYQAGPWRDYFRSTRAHNTVEVMHTNQSEVWGSFRVARRARPKDLFWHVMPTYTLAQAAHDGYQRCQPPVTHRRTLLWVKGCFWVVVDELLGQGASQAQSHIHLHPTLDLSTHGQDSWEIANASLPLWLSAFGQHSSAIICGQTEPLRQGWYSEKFGQLQSNKVLQLTVAGQLPATFGYGIAKHEPVQLRVTSGTGRTPLKIECVYHQQVYLLEIGQGTGPELK